MNEPDKFPATNNEHSKPTTAFIEEIPFACVSWDTILEEIDSNRSAHRSGYISITNTESLYFALRNEHHKSYVQKANFSCCDGVAIVLAAKAAGISIPRLHGPDLMLKCCEFGQDRGWKHFFYGGKQGVPERLAQNLRSKYPKLDVVGTYSPPFRKLTDREEEGIVKMINDSGADMVWVGLGLLKQENWIAEHLDNTNARWFVGVGASFDFYGGTVKRAPDWVQMAGLEWLHRAILEPRMWIRHARALRVFLYVIFRRSIFRVDQ